jgi:uncharacterized membrane protein required for colicin V production
MIGELSLVDAAIGVIMLIAIVRGLTIGLIRETFSMAALGAAVLAARYGAPPVGVWLTRVTGGETGPVPPNWIAGTVLAILAALAVAGLGYLIRRGVRLVGLSWADRIGGGALGALEGLVIGLLIVMGVSFFFGRNHPSLRDSTTLTIYDELRQYADEHGANLPSVAAPGGS